WFLRQFAEIAAMRAAAAEKGLDGLEADDLRRLKRAGFGDQELALAVNVKEAAVRERRLQFNLKAVYKRVDTCAAEFESFTPYMYSTYEQVCEANPNGRDKVVILGSGPNRIGQGIEFDYCCCHASFALKEEGLETIMINCNPETVSTDYDTADRLYFNPLARYMTNAVDAWPEHPLLVDKFLEDAFEFDVDAIADATGAVVIGGIMEHIEEAGIHSGDSSCVVPPFICPERHLATIRDYTRRIARALKVVGLMNVQYALKGDVVYVLEVNPRASRTVPYLSKAAGVSLAKVAAKVMAGRTLAELGLHGDVQV